MVDDTTAIIAAIIAGLAGGFLSSWMAFNASGEKFDPRKHGNALITGALTGVALGIAMLSGFSTTPSEATNAQFIAGLVGIFLAAVGVDRLRTSSSGMVANRVAERTEATTTTTTPATTTTTPK